DRNRSHWSTSKTPSYTKSVSWQHHRFDDIPPRKMIGEFIHGECPYTFSEQAAKKQMRSR
ncbi:hypothetical protein, partial [Escherichia coli]|uniref:hypothetical protein n=1 Tax=Escherichia coli TaxID=562 RepID=UPI001C8CA8AD